LIVRSLWLEEALPGAEDAPRLEGDEQADVCVVGGGFTGLWTALALKEHDPACDVVVLEADVCGGGASGRNGGFVLSWWAKLGKLEVLCGGEAAVRLARASVDAIDGICAFCERHGIDARVRRDGWLWTATSQAQLGAWEGALVACERLGERPFERLEPAEVARRTGSGAHLGGVFEPTAATLQPALLARGLRRVALEQGVRIFERSPMRGLRRSGTPLVRTAHGSVSAGRVVLALNAWLAQVSELSRSLFVIASDIVATPPVPERLAEIGWTDGLAISDSRLLVNYYRTTQDGRIVFGQGGGALARGGRIGRVFQGAPPGDRTAHVARSFHALYPQLADVPTPIAWTGPIDRTHDGLPFFGRLGGKPDVVYGGGYSGNGVGPSYLGGRILASLALGLDDEWAAAAALLPARGGLPPEPLRYAGARIVRAAVARAERAEDAGRRPGRVTARVAALAPAGLVPLKKP
jgi:putative aminophosphonate oxidoreductase